MSRQSVLVEHQVLNMISELELDDPEVPEMPELEREKLEQKAKPKQEEEEKCF